MKDRCDHGVRFPHECKDCIYEECECAIPSRGVDPTAGPCHACGRWVPASRAIAERLEAHLEDLHNESRATDPYHAHLDACTRCSSRPFDLCPEGAALLKRAAT